jgi:transposase
MDLVAFYQRILSPPAPWRVSRVECYDSEKRVDVWLEHVPAKFRCEHCMAECVVYDHAPERAWRHLNSCEYQTFIHARIPRVKCPLCGVVNASVPFATPGLSVTLPLEELSIKALRECTMAGAEGLLGVTARKLQHIQKTAVERGIERRNADVSEMMGLDEKQVFARHKYFTIITDLREGKVLDVLDGRKLEAITPWFEERKWELKFTEVVAVDMNAGYSSLARSFMPNADICFDKFHVMQVLNNAVDSTRKEEQRTMDEEQRRKMFGSRYCFLYGKENLPDKNRKRFEQAKTMAKKTARAWGIKEAFRDIWNLPPPDFEGGFKRWHWWATHSRLPYVAEAGKTLKRHFAGILNAVIHGVTNALTEGLNNKIEAIKRNACGYRNKGNFRTAILFHCGKLDLLPHRLEMTH